jgi:hypothetical protein
VACPVNHCPVSVCIGINVFIVVSAITLLVLGVLGLYEKIPVSPFGARMMLGTGVGAIIGMIGGIVKYLCSDANASKAEVSSTPINLSGLL